MTRVLVVDDHPVVREGIVAVLQDQPDLEVVGSAGSAGEACKLAGDLAPDVVVLDLELPDAEGAGAVARLKETVPGVQVLVFTAYGTDERVLGALQAGARGYLLKGAPADEIARAVRVLAAGGSHLGADVAGRVVAAAVGPCPHSPQLTPREGQVLQLVAQGLPNKQIARELGISERTVKFHVGALLAKLGVENRAGAVAVAAQRGLLAPPCARGNTG